MGEITVYRLGIDLGSSTVKTVLMNEDEVIEKYSKKHYGKLIPTLLELLDNLCTNDKVAIAVTGGNCKAVLEICPEIYNLGDIPSAVAGMKYLSPDVGSMIEIGSQGARFITDLDKPVPRFSVNEHCAGGTGSFFEDQMSRLGMKIENYSECVSNAQSIPRLSGRCAVFAKTDIIHRQQEGVTTPDILLGLCYAMIRNYKATIVRDLPVKKPLAFSGGVTKNIGVIRAIKDVFKLEEDELIVPDLAVFTTAIGASLNAAGEFDLEEIKSKLKAYHKKSQADKLLPALSLLAGTDLSEPKTDGKLSDKCCLGIDIGSTSTDLVITDENGKLVDFQYLRTAGNPEAAVRKGFENIRKKFGEISFRAVGVTGSGRERVGRMLGADAIRDEITAQARAAVQCDSEVDTVFEIGGQDSKYISIKNGEVADFQMNKICAAGTGSFVEEQAVRMNIPITEFGKIALSSKAPCELGERCTVFIETAISSAEAQGSSQSDIAAGLCHSIVRNYLHKVVGSKPVGKKIVLQGGVAYNPGIVAAFQSAYGDRLSVSPCFSISGAYGAALLAAEAIGERKSTFKGFDFSGQEILIQDSGDEIRNNILFYKKTDSLLREGYDGKIDPNKKTVGIPLVLVMHKFFPMANAFFKSLGFNVVLTEPTNEETIQLSQQYAQGETCYPVKLIYGHMVQLIEKKVDYIFLPAVHTMKHENSKVAYNYGCVYMQTAAKSIANILKFEEKGIKLLNPVFDLDFGKKAMVESMIGIGKQLGFSAPRSMKALLNGAMAVKKFSAQVEELGKNLLSSLKPDDKVLVLITRNYGVSDPVLNMGIPEILLNRGYKVITLSHLPGHDIDISEDYPNLYWPFGQHILSGAKLIANHPNLYAVYLTNHGCGPDSVISHLFKEEMGDKPYLQIEVDEHFSKVGVITRVEAFLNSLSHRPAVEIPDDFDIKNVKHRAVAITENPEKEKTLYIPNLALYTKYIAEYFRDNGYTVEELSKPNEYQLSLGRAETNAKEYYPFTMLVGEALSVVEKDKNAQFLVPFSRGSETDGQYTRAIRAILDRKGYNSCVMVSPILETIPKNTNKLDLFFRAMVIGDVLYSADIKTRTEFAPETIPSWEDIISLAEKISGEDISGRKISAVGTPMCVTSLDDGILEKLENDGNYIRRMPLAEYLLFLWEDSLKNEIDKSIFVELEKKILAVAKALGERNPYSDISEMMSCAEKYLPNFSGGNGRYRYAKTIAEGKTSDAVITMSPRYENTSMVLDMRFLQENCEAPIFQANLDGDIDDSSWERLNSFLFYVKH